MWVLPTIMKTALSKIENNAVYTDIVIVVDKIENVKFDYVSGDLGETANAILINLENDQSIIKSLHIGFEKSIDKILFLEAAPSLQT